ncbi:hypothetical protein LTR53_007543 [Teratosphaeriaceae sp. CCFEE 6253]|nr:hypothetical protein LTR53_007543 [Teratosphaeriaceae sp. CCFEE 6253]
MASTGSLFSQTLQDITNTKLDELAKRRHSFEQHRTRILAAAEDDGDLAGSLLTIADAIKAAFGINTVDGRLVRGSSDSASVVIDLKNLDRFLAQAKYDPTVGNRALQQWRATLLRHVEAQSLKYKYAWLYGQLTTEWLSAKAPPPAPKGEDSEMQDYEHVSSAKRLEARAKWEESVFVATPVDQTAIEKMLHGLFEASPDGSTVLPKALEALRDSVKAFEERIPAFDQFSVQSLHWNISGLLAGDLLTNEKRDALRDFDNNDTILREVADVLNMRLASLQDWTWGKEVLLEERRQLNGTFNIFMHEDLLQTLFLQHIGVKWSVFWKTAFRRHRNTKEVWKSPGSKPTLAEKQRREYYLGVATKGPTVFTRKTKRYLEDYYVSQLLSSVNQETEGREGDEEADFEIAASAVQQMPMQQMQQAFGRTKQTARKSTGGKAPRMQMASRAMKMSAPEAEEEGEYEGLDDDMGFGHFDEDDSDYMSDVDDHKARNPMAAKQNLLHMLSTDILVQIRLRGEVACFRSQIDNLYPRLPHGTIQAVLRYLGVSEKWLQFFVHFLEAPLRFKDDESAEPRQRKTGTPGSHMLSEVFSEVILWCLDFTINQKTDGEILWRMNDDLWFWSSHEKCASAWSTVGEFTQIMGLETNETRTGSARIRADASTDTGLASVDVGEDLPRGQIRWGMLYLDAQSGRFMIDQAMVDTHIDELRRQLRDKGNSAFAWIQTFNAYASTFFTTNFGNPANCFGRQHVDNMLATHNRIQNLVFTSGQSGPAVGDGSFVEYLKGIIATRQGVEDIPDGYFYFPSELGGLEVQSPFITLLQVRDVVLADFDKVFNDFDAAEREAYRRAKRTFEDGQPAKKHRRTIDRSFRPEDPETFFSFEEYTKYREELNYSYGGQLVDVFTRLLERPRQQGIETELNGPIHVALRALPSSKIRDWHLMEPYWKYVAQLYGPELIERFGGFRIVDPGLLPMGMVGLFRSGRVKWQE